MERTLLLVKPDGVQRGLVGQILRRFERVGLKIVALKMVQMDRDLSKRHYRAHVDRAYYACLEDFIVSGPVVAAAFEGLHAIETVRKLVGATEPRAAAPGTIRGDFAMHSIESKSDRGLVVRNLVHASGCAEDAEVELALWFDKRETFSYPRCDDGHVL